jgi:hypothetical protein
MGAMKRRAEWALAIAALATVACGSSATTTTEPRCDGACVSAEKDAGHAGRDAGHDARGKHDSAGGHGERDAAKDARHDAERHDARKDAPLPVAGLDAGKNQWTFTYIPGSACLDGSQTGFAVNPAPEPSEDLMIFLEGGGACWDATTCWGPVTTAFYVATGYGQVEFSTDPQVDLYVLDRTNTENPFRNMNLAFVPYCTGDVLDGSKVTSLSYLGVSHETHFVGHDNMVLFLQYVAATFPKTTHVWLAGDSAGGFGTALNFELTQAALPKAHIDVLDDSGQPIEPAAGNWSMWIDAWNAQLPAGCPGCKTDPGAFVDYFQGNYPSSRFGLVSYQYDTVISTFMGLSLTQFNTELLGLASNMDAHWPNGHYFIIQGASHVGLLAPTSQLETWVTQLVTGDPAWTSVKP